MMCVTSRSQPEASPSVRLFKSLALSSLATRLYSALRALMAAALAFAAAFSAGVNFGFLALGAMGTTG